MFDRRIERMRDAIVLFEGSPALVSNMPVLLEGAFASVLAVAITAWLASRGVAAAWWIWIVVASVYLLRLAHAVLDTVCTHITIDALRIRLSSGVLLREVASLELFRVQNVWSVVRWWQRPLGIGDLIIETSDPRHPVWRLAGLPDPERLRDTLNEAAVELRGARGVREINVGQV
ncbi:PH domain-containing protein [Burkholderia pseudomallei]|uniref:PH domain-containing protein n=1 Tax=Burkholderia pseudomallei TaxID=28450 RepID=UPI0005728504|nr:PH domain-containing protein [Burkholderia pseudomallei]